jgi:RimJ/RimL family protein N-acetyltransferase
MSMPDPASTPFSAAQVVGEPPPLQRTAGRWITLQPVRHADYDAIRAAELSDELGVRWRHRGATPSPEAFAQVLWAGVLVQYLVVDNDDHRLVGLVSAYNADLQSGTCHMGFARFDPTDRSPGMIEGVLLVADHLFTHWTFRKLYGETLEFNLANLGGVLGPLLTEEGRLREHVFAGGRYWDLSYLALYREVWETHRARLLPAEPDLLAPRPIEVRVPGAQS